MSDPIDKLTRLGDALEGAPMPLPASEIRARGDRIRRRKHALVAGASAAAVAAVAVPVLALSLGDDDSEPDFTPSPTITDPVEPGALGASNLLTEQDAIWYEPGQDWVEERTLPGDGQAPPNPCQQQSFAGLGADTVYQREFSWKARSEAGAEPPYLNELIGEFGSAAEAQAAYEEIQGWHADCLPAGADTYSGADFQPVDLPVDGEGVTTTATYGPVAERIDPFGDEFWWLDIGLVVSGDRVALVTALSHGQDFNFEVSPAAQMVPAAAERLVLGEGGQVEPTEPAVVEGTVTDIPDDFPLDGRWPADDGSDEHQLEEPSREVDSLLAAGQLPDCGQPAADVAPADRLTARLTLGSAFYASELQLFASEEDALRFFDSVQDAGSVCEAEATGYTVEQAVEDNVAVLWSEGVGRSVTIAHRHGNAVLITVDSDEGATGVDTVGRMWTGVGESNGFLYEAVAELVDGTGTDTGEGPAIPDDLPLDVDMVDMGADGEYHAPYRPAAGEEGLVLAPCGQEVWPAAGTADQLWTWATGPEYGDRRELVTFATVDDAVAAMDAIESAIAGCQREGTEIWTAHEADTGYVSLTFSRTYDGLGLDLYQATRVGTAVLMTSIYGEGTLQSVDAVLPSRTAVTRSLAPSLCVFTEDGCL